METAQNSIISIDMWGQRQRRHRFFNDNEINKNNLELTERFFKEISSNKDIKTLDENNSLLVEDVPYDDIINFVQK